MSKLKAIPAANYMFITCNKTVETKGGIILTGGSGINTRQTVLKIGPSVRTFEPGMDVEIDTRFYEVRDWKDEKNPTLNEELHKKVKRIAWPIEVIDGIEVMRIGDNHVWHYWPKEENTGSKFDI